MWGWKLRFDCLEAGYVRKFSQYNVSLDLFSPGSWNAFFQWADLMFRPIHFLKTLCGVGKDDKLYLIMSMPNQQALWGLHLDPAIVVGFTLLLEHMDSTPGPHDE